MISTKHARIDYHRPRMESKPPTTSQPEHDVGMVETLQSLIVAFVLAMAFRGFVVEGFVIPTGSMAPTLMGAHARVQSRQTGWSFAAGMDQGADASTKNISDPMLGPGYSGPSIAGQPPARRMGDRILVLKCLYPFSQPQRYDVVVFKNPTRSQGDEANYIKRLVGLPDEELWFCDGDVFVRRPGEVEFSIQRKPAHIQRAVWQPVYHSDFVPVSVERLNEESRRRYEGPPWTGDASAWSFDGRTYRADSAASTELRWDPARRAIDDWTAYNMLVPPAFQSPTVPVSDVRVSATIVADAPGLTTTLELQARSHVFEFIVEPTRAIMRLSPAADQGGPTLEREAAIEEISPGEAFAVECWQADQSLRIFINGDEVMPALEYEWSPVERLRNATGVFNTSDARTLLNRTVLPPRVRWKFNGSPVTLSRVRLDRDLFYRRDMLRAKAVENPTNPGFERVVRPGLPGFGTHPDNPARIGPDQFMMAGDNSQMSLDSRLWGNPDPLVASQIDPSPFVVNRKLLLGKAWVVYFPAPLPLFEGGRQLVPDFGRLRFIR